VFSLIPALQYDRVCRTPHSEAYLLSDGDQPLGRVDLHFGTSLVHAVLIVERDLSQDEVRGLVHMIDEDLVATADVPREDFVVTVYRGSELAVLSDDVDDDLQEGAADGDEEQE